MSAARAAFPREPPLILVKARGARYPGEMPAFAMVHRLPPASMFAVRVDRARAGRLEALLEDRAADVRAAQRACAALRRDDSAAADVDAITRDLLEALRRHDPEADAEMRRAERVDDVLRSDRLEYLDRDDVPGAVKRLGMRLLDRVNVALGSYDVWAGAIDALLGDRPRVHVYDLAAGTGGFARWLAAHPPATRAWRITSSDLDPEYVAIGARLAARAHLDVAFEARDALDLRDVRDVDLFLCTQATHHLAPGQVVRMVAQAIAAAPRGVVVVDLRRSILALLGTGLVVAMTAPFPPLVHDGIQSVRRSYTVSELTLFARLAGARAIDAHMLGPAHCILHAYGVGDA